MLRLQKKGQKSLKTFLKTIRINLTSACGWRIQIKNNCPFWAKWIEKISHPNTTSQTPIEGPCRIYMECCFEDFWPELKPFRQRDEHISQLFLLDKRFSGEGFYE